MKSFNACPINWNWRSANFADAPGNGPVVVLQNTAFMFGFINYEGFLVGLFAFLIIGIFHPVVIRVEYHYGKGVWPFFLVSGIVSATASLFIAQRFISVLLGVLGFALIWSTLELFKQHQRVLKGQAKRNPRRNYHES